MRLGFEIHTSSQRKNFFTQILDQIKPPITHSLEIVTSRVVCALVKYWVSKGKWMIYFQHAINNNRSPTEETQRMTETSLPSFQN